MTAIQHRSRVTTRITFNHDFVQSMRERGLTLADVAKRARVSPATVSSAARGRAVNMRTAIEISRVMANTPVIEELASLAARDEGVPDYYEEEE